MSDITTAELNRQDAESQLPDGWRWVKLKDIGLLTDGDWILNMDYTPSGVRLLQVGDVGVGEFVGKSSRFITMDRAKELGCTFLQAGDVLISRMPDPMGRACLMPDLGYASITAVDVSIWRPKQEIADREFVTHYLNSQEWFSRVMKEASGATRPRISRSNLENLEIPLPPLAEQKRIAGILKEQMAAVERARRPALAGLQAAESLPAAHLRAVFNSPEAQSWPKKRIEEACELLPSKSISTAGDAEVCAITTACLSESGFRPSGTKTARMWAGDAEQCIVSEGEVLIARSNTPDLVGRAAMFTGEPKGAVASDLTIRLKARAGLLPVFLTAHLAFLYLSGYWKERAGGASGTMKKITRTQIQSELIPVPSDTDQHRIAAQLSSQMASAERLRQTLAEQLAAINSLPAALLRRAFNGEL